MDFFTDSYYDVELEKDMTIQEQFLDVVILRKSEGKPPPPLPDGLENLSVYNLLSYKSLNEPLTAWTDKGFIFGDKHYHWHNPKSQQLLN